MKLLDFIPPVLTPLLRKLVTGSGQKLYANYTEALADCSEHGYENADIVNIVVEKTRRYRDSLFKAAMPVQINATSGYSLCSLLASMESTEISVLDFGGAAGAHYFVARTILPSSCSLNWLVVETPAMAEKAKHVLSNDELIFSSDLSDAAKSMKRIDLLHTSGTLQCIDNSYDYLERLTSISANHILFNRLGLTKGTHDVITIHESWLSWNGPGPMPNGFEDRKVRYPFVFPRESEFMEILSKRYEVKMNFDDTSGIFPVKDEPIIGGGLLARRRI
jgi:putative methyltransferase (TIGR04325 family)